MDRPDTVRLLPYAGPPRRPKAVPRRGCVAVAVGDLGWLAERDARLLRYEAALAAGVRLFEATPGVQVYRPGRAER